MDLVVGLTGGIGSGKSAAADAFAKLGAAVVDTDAIAHELTAAGGAAVPEVRRLFGSAYVDASGAMDRKRMRSLVFSDAEEKQRLEALLHPMIRAESERRIATVFRNKAAPYVIYVVPLLIESPDYRSRVDRVLVVDSPERLQLERVRSRGLSDDDIRAIIAAQGPFAADQGRMTDTDTRDVGDRVVRSGLHTPDANAEFTSAHRGRV